MVRRKSDNNNYSLRKWRGGRIFLITIESLKGASLLGDRGIDRFFFSLSLSPFILLIPRVFDGWISGNEMQLNTVDQIYPRLDNALNVKITSNVVLFRGYY